MRRRPLVRWCWLLPVLAGWLMPAAAAAPAEARAPHADSPLPVRNLSPATQIFGLQVAGLAGVPKAVIRQARKYLELLEEQSLARGGQDDLFAGAGRRVEPEPPQDPVRGELAKINPDELSPREALELLYRLKKI